MIGEIWIQANMSENGIVDLMTMENKKCIDADALELAYRRIKDAESLGEHSGGYVYNRLFETLLQAPEVFPAGLLRWIKTAERKPTAVDMACVVMAWTLAVALAGSVALLLVTAALEIYEEHFHR